MTETKTDKIFIALKELLQSIAPTRTGFYRLSREDDLPNITVQPTEFGNDKKQGEMDVFIILTIDSSPDNAINNIVNISNEIKQKIIENNAVNSALNGLVTEFKAIDKTKIINPEQHQGTAQVIFTCSIKYSNKS